MLERESKRAADDGLSVAVLVAWCFQKGVLYSLYRRIGHLDVRGEMTGGECTFQLGLATVDRVISCQADIPTPRYEVLLVARAAQDGVCTPSIPRTGGATLCSGTTRFQDTAVALIDRAYGLRKGGG